MTDAQLIEELNTEMNFEGGLRLQEFHPNKLKASLLKVGCHKHLKNSLMQDPKCKHEYLDNSIEMSGND